MFVIGTGSSRKERIYLTWGTFVFDKGRKVEIIPSVYLKTA